MRPALMYGSGFPTLLRKEIKRFYKVAFQTVAAPVPVPCAKLISRHFPSSFWLWYVV